jgi:ubiquinone/menaquinone biosynthesis C-methylase UbiE
MSNHIPQKINNDAIAFYNTVAPEYDLEMSADTTNNNVRAKISSYFVQTVLGENILDFGGGTGLDLPWLLNHNYKVTFCEPAPEMRNIAIQLNQNQLKNEHITFLSSEQSDFNNWYAGTFENKFDAVLANFGVINSIADIGALINKLNSVLKPGGHIIANMLDTTPGGIMRWYKKNFVKAILANSPPVMITQFKGTKHTSFLHTPGKIEHFARHSFECKKIERIGGFGFMLVHLQKKAPTNQIYLVKKTIQRH